MYTPRSPLFEFWLNKVGSGKYLLKLQNKWFKVSWGGRMTATQSFTTPLSVQRLNEYSFTLVHHVFWKGGFQWWTFWCLIHTIFCWFQLRSRLEKLVSVTNVYIFKIFMVHYRFNRYPNKWFSNQYTTHESVFFQFHDTGVWKSHFYWSQLDVIKL